MSVLAADFADDLAEIRLQVKSKLGIAENNITAINDSTLNRFIREAVVTLSPDIIGINRIDTVITLFKQNMYLLDTSVTQVTDVWWRKKDSIKSLTYLPRYQWYQQKLRTLMGKKDYEARPAYFDFLKVRDDTCYLTVYPAPVIHSETLFVLSVAKVENISDATGLSSLSQTDRAKVVNYTAYLTALYLHLPNPEKQLISLSKRRGNEVDSL